jgi:carbon-monoxide dehydrogenase large subunit
VAEKNVQKSLKRNEDPRLLVGKTTFIDDIDLPGMLHVAIKRSDYSHGRIVKLDVEEAKKLPGVVAIYTAEDLGDYWRPGPLQVPPPTAIKGSVFHARPLECIAKNKIRFSGEPVAVVVAESRYIAEDALDYIVLDVENLDYVGDLEKALEPGAPLIHEDLDSNLAADVVQEVGSWEQAVAEADLVVKRRLEVNRVAGAAMENRGFVAQWDENLQVLNCWATTQGPIPMRNSIANYLGLMENQVRLMNPAIGGGFGPKIMSSQIDDVVIPWIAIRLKRPIKWFEDRRENFLGTTSERDQVHYAEIAVKKDGTILGVKDVMYHNTGAYNPYGMTVPLNTQTHTVSNYRVPNFFTEIKMVFTNQMVVTPVRGAGRSQGVFVMERLLDAAAKELGMDVVEIRRKNVLTPEEFPLRTGVIGQDFVEGVLDNGNYPAALEKTVETIGYDKFKKEIQPKLRAEGKHVGVGICMFTEGTAVGPYEGAKVMVGVTGKVTVFTAYSNQGQGHYTTFAQVAADQLGVNVKDINVVIGDTGQWQWGVGAFASRGMTLVGTAIHNASLKVRQKALGLASKVLNTPEDELEMQDGVVRVADMPEKFVTLGELAQRSNPTRGTVEEGMEPGLEAASYYGPPHGATGYGCLGMIISVDAETAKPKIERLVMTDDCGTPVNPMIVDGQLHGGLQMGIGEAFYENLVYDDYGQLLSASFMDYLFPQASDMPDKFEINHMITPSPLNPLGIKGVGEAGVIATPACFMQALEDAINIKGMEIVESSISPSKLYHYMEKAKSA